MEHEGAIAAVKRLIAAYLTRPDADAASCLTEDAAWSGLSGARPVCGREEILRRLDGLGMLCPQADELAARLLAPGVISVEGEASAAWREGGTPRVWSAAAVCVCQAEGVWRVARMQMLPLDEPIDEHGYRFSQLDRDMLLTAAATVYPLVISVNLSRNNYHMISYDAYTTRKAEDQGSFDELIEVGASTIPEEDREAFVRLFSRPSLLAAHARGEREVRLQHRQMGDDGKMHWIETTVFFVENAFDGDVRELTLSRIIDEQKAVEARLEELLRVTSGELETERRYQKLIQENIPGCLAVYASGRPEPLYISGMLHEPLGYTREELAGFLSNHMYGFLYEEDYDRTHAYILRNMDFRNPSFTCEARVYRKDGSLAWLEERGTLTRNPDGQPVYVVILMDITRRKAMEEDLRISKEKMDISMSRLGLMIYGYSLPERTLVMPKGEGARFGLGDVVHDMPDRIIESGAIAPESVQDYRAMYRAIHRGDPEGGCEYHVCPLTGEPRWMRARFINVFDDRGEPVEAILTTDDITAQRAALDRLERRAQQDGLTGLYNREATQMRINRRLSLHGGSGGALLLVDVDGLKSINDSFGHPEGDVAIRAVADRLKRAFRQSDIVGRIGGDEFAVFLPGEREEERICSAVARLQEMLDEIRLGGDERTRLSCSIGVAEGGKGETFDALYARADKALYKAKHMGKNRCAFYYE